MTDTLNAFIVVSYIQVRINFQILISVDESLFSFWCRGHLAKTRIIPALKRMNYPYTPIVRHEVPDLWFITLSSDARTIASVVTRVATDATSWTSTATWLWT